MDIVNIIITAMLIGAAVCGIALVWPVREPRDRDAAGVALGAGARPADKSDGRTGDGGAGG